MSGMELHEAASCGDVDTLEEHLKSGKHDPNLKDPEWKNKTPLHWAAEKGYVQCIRLLMDHGAKGTSKMSMGWTPAHCAAEGGKLNALQALHDGYKVPVNRKDKYGDTPKRIAEIYGHKECVKFLTEAEKAISERTEKLAGSGQAQTEEWSDEAEDEEEGEAEDEEQRDISYDTVTNSTENSFSKQRRGKSRKNRSFTEGR